MSADNVETITTALAATKVSDPAQEQASKVAAEEGRRLYIGNLAYVTTEAQLKEFFNGYAVESVSIPLNPRTSRAVGYAFVDVASKEEAEKAIDDLSGKEILERKVSVQVARKPGVGPPATNGEAANGNDDSRPRRGRGGARGGRGGRGERGDRGGRFRSRGSGTRAVSDEAPGAPATATGTTETPTATTSGTKTEKTQDADGNEDGGFRGRRKRGPPENGVASTTKVMVANLPYELSEQALKDLFSAYDPESAKIALRPIPRFMVRKLQARGEARKGRGFGFVTLPSEELQKKAVDEMNGKVIEGREIAVKVAIDNPKDEENNNGQDPEEGTAADGAAGAAEAEATIVS